ncbi:MAG: hypothetical protein NVSMB9_15620 [Isosphaeraceae bacterium]
MEFDQFRVMRGRKEFIESAEYNGHYYGTPARPVYQALKDGKSVILEIEVQGALQIRDNAPSSFFVFVRTPSFRILEERLRERGTEIEASIIKRLKKARQELAEAHWYDALLVNDNLDTCVEDFVALLKNLTNERRGDPRDA